MKTFKKLASLVIALTMITSSLAFTIPASAAEIDDSSSQSANANLQSNVQDGVILHAFNWSYNAIKENLPAIAAAGYSTVQTSPVQQPKDYTVSADVSGQWWKLYQPVSMQIAQQSWLGTKAELTSLCAEADKYGIKIICDIVSNHMGNDKETDPSSLSPQIKTYQPDFYNNKSSYFHSYSGSVNDSSVQAVVQGHVSNAPDLNTSNSNVQNAVISLLKDCIDCGVDGFRFDAAKHIETPDDGSYASNYWSNVSSSAKSYYKQKTGKDLFIYGEILNTCGSGRSYGSYTKYINVTDNKTGDAVLANVDKSNASGAASSSYQSGQSASKLVLWAESHDTYEGDSGSASGYQNTSKVSNENVSKAWAIVAARKDATSLFFARPGSALMGEVSTDTTYKSTAVAEVNKFHNAFVGQSEKLGSSDGVAYVARGNGGIVLANCSGTTKNVSISGTGLANGTYTDTVSGNQFTVSGGTVSGKIGSTGIAVVYKASVTPRNTCSVESGSFKGETMTVELGLDNATSGTYCLDDSTPVTYTGKTTIRIGSDYKYGETINLTLTATNGSDTETTTYHYLKNEDDGSGVYVFFNAKNRSSWTAPYNVYIYDEDSSSTITYKNASWPGQTMKYDSASGYYYVEVPKTCIATDKSGNVLPSTSFNLATSPKTYVIINASGKNQQYPGDGSSTKLALGGSSKLFAGTSAKSFTTTTLKPASTTVEATDVTKGTVAPTTEPTTTVPVTTTEPTTTAPITTTEPTTTAPITTAPAKYNYGDVDLNGSINIADSTIIQKYIAHSVTLSELQLILADVSQDEKVNVKDATLIQRYVAKLGNCGRTGQPYYSGQPETTQPTTAEIPTTTQPETTQPTTAETPTTTQAQTDPITLNGDYYLFGYINGANYGCEEDYQTLGDYHFVNGQVTATFDQVSYVAVKTADNKSWFMTDGFEGKVNSVTLYNTSSLGEDADKLMVPAGTATFTLNENSDGTLTLSYVSDGEFVDDTTSVTDPTGTNPSLNGDYYLFGYINGANYGCEEDYQTLGDYHFVNGQVTATFDQVSYVAVKTADNKSWFMTDGFEGKVNSATLYNTSSLGEDADKLMVPAGTATFTLTENSDGTLTLSYVSDGEFVDDTTSVTDPTSTDPTGTNPSLNGDYYLFGYINGANYGCEEDYQTLGDYHFVNGQVTATFDQVSYVAVKTADNKSWFMTDGFEGKVNSATLYNTSSLGEDADKLMVPAGTATFTLNENSDGTLTLSYVSDGEFVDDTTSVTDPTGTNPSLNGDYYLFGYINGANYGCEEDYQTLGDYHFVNGQVTATFDQVSYVAVKTADNKSWFMTDGFEGKVNSVTLYNTSSLGEDADKLMVPAGTATFTLSENSDGTLTLSYVSDGEFVDETTEPTTQDTTTTDPVSDTYTITFTNNKNWSKVNCYYWGTNDTTLSTWPGEGMTYSTTNDFGEKIYTIEIPNTADHIIFNDGGSNQTVDITIIGSAKYYISGGSGKAYTVATWE